jgi:dTMP kinase
MVAVLRPEPADDDDRGEVAPAEAGPSPADRVADVDPTRGAPVTAGLHGIPMAPTRPGMFDPTGDVLAEAAIDQSAPNDRPGWHVRLFGSHEFFRLWIVQVVSATGDWLGLLAVTYFARDLFPDDPNAAAAAISLVIAVRLLPHLFFSPLAGVIVDRFDRKKVMIFADLARACILVLLPLVKNLPALIVASLLLEMFTLLWTPAKEAITPQLVPPDHLTTANSLNLAAGYATAPIATLIFTLLAGLSTWLGGFEALAFLQLNQTALAFLFDALTFVFSALMLRSLGCGRTPRERSRAESHGYGRRRLELRGTLGDLKEGWQYVFLNDTVRAVNLSLGIALVGGGMLIPLGAVFASEVLGAGAAGYGVFTTSLMFGVAIGVLAVSALQRRLPRERVFALAFFVAGFALFIGATTNRLGVATVAVFVMGAFVGPIYVLGYSILHQRVDDELRGRVFAALNTLVRFCVLIALVGGPLLSAALDTISNDLVGGEIDIAGITYFVPGVRLTLWIDALLIMAGGFVAVGAVRRGERRDAAEAVGHPSRPPIP